MRSSLILAWAAAFSAVQAATVPACKACKQDACMDSIIQEECGEYLVIVETPSTTTIIETAFATVVPTVVSHVSVSTTVLNNITTTVNVHASHTIDYTVTVVESSTAIETFTTTALVEVDPPVVSSPVKRDFVDDDGYDLPDYASACSDIYQYSSACECIGFEPSTSTAPAPSKTETVTETVTPSTEFVTSTIATLSFTRNATTIPVTQTVSTVSVSQVAGTVTQTTVVATNTITQVAYSTITRTPTTTLPAPTPTYIGQVRGPGGIMVENINVPPGAHIGVIATIRQTSNPATWAITPDGVVTIVQNPPTHVPYRWFYYVSAAGYSYVQVTSDLVASIMGVRAISCKVIPAMGPGEINEIVCSGTDGVRLELWACGRHMAVVKQGNSAAFQGTCATPIVSLDGALQLDITSIED